jgi:uncharacterized protein (DUF849 family)
MLLKAAINGKRMRNEHPAIPLTPHQQAKEAAAAVAAGAGAFTFILAIRMAEKVWRLTM